ncbi:dynamin-binding protein-like isoform X2 [Ischnura elegans]|uniref:dynamin-binding protein-like isoform X2 n=1 Tax=Ischnura elegans TaxID=197161 RepID=UPI001ED8B70E|nr:dynamin-binding protein-like isoform X2 [Ischnura elegans]
MEEGSLAKVINDFLSTNEGELCLTKGDIVQIIKKEDMHWCYGCSAGKQGLIHTNYLMELDDPVLEDGQELFVSLADFQAQQADDLFFKKGEIIIGLRAEDDNWWRGKIGDRVGVFPRNYVWQLNSDKFKKTSLNRGVLMKAVVKTSMKAQLDEEMDLNEGDIVTITGMVDGTWYRGICGNREGIFPKNFVTLLGEDSGNTRSLPNDNHLITSFSTQPSYLSDFSDFPRSSEFPGISSDFPSLPPSSFPPLDSSAPKQGSLITFSPDEPKEVPTSSFSLTNFNSMDDSLCNGVFGSSDLEQLPSVFDECGSHNDNGGLSPYGITLYPFYGQFDNELSCHEGEIVTLIRHVNEDWVEGEIEGKKGILPVSYVNILIDCEYSMGESNRNESSKNSAKNRLRLNSSAKVVYNFHAQMNSDISVREGEVVYITEVVNEDWCRVKNSEDVVGLCPSNHLAPLSAWEELIGLEFPQNPSPIDSLPSYNDACLVKEYDTNQGFILPDINAKGDSYDRSLDFSLSKRPKSVDDLIAKNMASLNFDFKTAKVPSGDDSESRLIGNTDSVGSKKSIGDIPKEGDSKTLPNLGPGVQRNSMPPLSKPSRPSYTPSPSSTSAAAADSAFRRAPVRLSGGESLQEDSKLHSRETPAVKVEFRRQGSDRAPHRPAPPIPVPGQTPVRRTIRRKKRLSPALSRSNSNASRMLASRETRPDEACGESSSGQNDQRVKDSEHRQNVISELAITEKEYVRDLKLTYETFNLHNEEFLESRGIDVEGIFGNLIEVMGIAETLLDKILFSMKNKEDEEQLIGPCFLELADDMKTIYSSYCMNHDTALTLLEKYEENESIQKIFNKGIETLRYQIACFDMGSILIKPVQRILKYPLILNELIKYTEDSHKDKPLLIEAVKRMTEVAMHINEFKRRKDLVSKYLDDGNSTLSNRMSKLSLHSVLKKSSRLGMKLSSSLGIGVAAKDPEFDAQELLFRSLEKSVKDFMRNVEQFYCGLEEVISCQCNCGEIISTCFDENKCSGVNEFKEAQKIVFSKYLAEFKSNIDSRVLRPLNALIELCEGPEKLIQKRNDKLLDYNRCLAKSEKNRDSKLVQDEILMSKNNYDALNSQLLEELPKLVTISYELFMECIAAFISARKLFTGRATKLYLSLCENHLVQSQGDILEVFGVKHSLVSNQIGRFSFVTKNFSLDPSETRSENKSPILGSSQVGGSQQVSQNYSQRVYLQSRYPPDKLFVAKDSYSGADPLDLPVTAGTLVAVIKNQDPMGNNKRWFVDSGGIQGFLPAAILGPMSGEANNSVDQNSASGAMSLGNGRNLLSMAVDKQLIPSNTKIDGGAVNRPKSETTNNLPPTYEEVVDSKPVPLVNTDKSFVDHRYEEPSEESTYNVSQFYYALYDFSGNGAHTLNITQGQVLKVKSFQDLRGNSEWWLVENRDGQSGYVPGNYLKKYS